MAASNLKPVHYGKSRIHIRLAFPEAENYFVLLIVADTLPEFDKMTEEMTLGYHLLLKWLPRSDFIRPDILLQVAALRTQRCVLSDQKSDLDKAITHLTEAVLLLPTQRIVFALFHLATILRSRFECANQPDDLKSAIIYLRFLRINFRSLEAFNISPASGDLPSKLFHALALNLVLTPGEMVQDLEEMIALIPEFITADISTLHRKHAIEAFGGAVTILKTEMYRDRKSVV